MPLPTSYAFATYQTAVGLGKETTRSTAIAPSVWLKSKAPKFKPNPAILEDDTLQGSAVRVYAQQLGLRYDTWGCDSFPYLDTFPFFLVGELGSPDSLTAAPANTTLQAAAAAGATTITPVGAVGSNTWITIDSGALLEVHYVTTGAAGGSAITLEYPLTFAHATGATATGLTAHKFSLLNNNPSVGNQPPSLSLYDFDGEQWRVLTGAQTDKLTIKGTGTTWVDYSVNFFTDPAVTTTTQTPSYTTTLAPPGWTTAVSLGGTQIKYCEDWQIDLSRNVKPIPALTGTQAYYEYFAGPLDATCKLTFIEQAGSPQLAAFTNSTVQSLNITSFDRSQGFGMRMLATQVNWKSGEIVRGKEWVEVTVEGNLIPSATDATAGGVSPIQISVGNATTTAYN